ncbi:MULTISPECIES: hypothetical protein [Burkholderia]|uniref:hypothetical protein n=1 Tax=Burkholderia TaxID=32008 RepID=UPI001F34235B|nr:MULTISPECIES: hypothetical protein [Burkholderia]
MDVRVYLLAAAVFLAGVAENVCVGIPPALSAGPFTTILAAVFGLAALVAIAFVGRIERRTAPGSALGGVLVERDALLVTPWAACALVAIAPGCACVSHMADAAGGACVVAIATGPRRTCRRRVSSPPSCPSDRFVRS